MIKSLSDKDFRLLFLLLFFLFYCNNIINFIYQGFLPTDENLFTDLPSGIISLETITGYVERDTNSKTDKISAGDLIYAVENQNVGDTTSFFRVLNSINSSVVKIGFYDRSKLIQRNLFVPIANLEREKFDQLSSGVIVLLVKKGGASHEAGIEPGDIILSIDGKQFKTGTEADRLLLQSSSGDLSYYEVLRGVDKKVFKVKLVAFGIDFVSLGRILASIIYLAVGFYLAFGKSKYFPIRLLSVAFLLIAALLASSNTRIDPLSNVLQGIRVVATILSLSFSFAVLMHFFFHFPKEQKRLLERVWIIRGLYILSLAIFGLMLYFLFSRNYYLINSFATFSFILFLAYRGIIVQKYRKEIIRSERRIVRPLQIFSVVLIVLLITATAIFYRNMEIARIFVFVNFALVGLFPFLLLYLLSRSNLYEIFFRIRRNILYHSLKIAFNTFLILIFLSFVYLASVLSLRFPNLHFTGSGIEILNRPLPLDKNISYEKVLITFLTLCLLSFFWIFKKRIDNFLKKRFYQSEINYRKTASELSELIVKNIKLSELARNILEEIKNLNYLKSVGLFIFQDEKKVCCSEFFGIAKNNIEAINEKFTLETINYIKNQEDRIPIEALNSYNGELLANIGFKYLLQIKYKDKIEGALLISEKLSESPFTAEDFEFLAIITGNIAIAIDNAFLYDELSKNERIKKELEIAQQIQTASLPKQMPIHPRLDIFGVSLPAYEVGGDFFDFFDSDNDIFTAIIGDVSGKGTSAALYMSKIQGILKTLSEFQLPLREMIARTNKLCVELIENKYFITLLAVQFDFRSKEVSIIRAGHLPLYHISGKDGKVEKILPNGVMLGYLSEQNFLQNSQEVVLEFQNGDVFVLVSDGVFEQSSDTNWRKSEQELIDLLKSIYKRSAKEITEEILSNICNFSLREELFDDMTILVIKSKHNAEK